MRFCGGVPLLSLFFCARQSTSAADCYGSSCNNCRRHVLRHKLCKHRLSVILNILYLYFSLSLFLFFAAIMRGGVLCLCLCLFLFLYLYPCFCFYFCFCLCFSLSVSVSILVSVFYSYLPLLRVFVSYRKEVVRFPVDLSERHGAAVLCFFTLIFRHRSGAAQRPTVLFTESTVILRSRAVGCFFIIIFSRLFLDFSG